ncbi:MAG TPA: hypothetical protein VE029_09055 [Rhizobacter sp.]|nr:hypothetical protein [Rhizobacter sp.]
MPPRTDTPCDHHQALTLAAQGNWDAAHKLAQVHDDLLSCQIHGYLHRIEGDLSNAGYWYRRGGLQALPANTLPEEAARLQALAGAGTPR